MTDRALVDGIGQFFLRLAGRRGSPGTEGSGNCADADVTVKLQQEIAGIAGLKYGGRMRGAIGGARWLVHSDYSMKKRKNRCTMPRG